MDGVCNTVKIVAEKVPGNDTGFIVINESDYNPEIHTLHGETAAADEFEGMDKDALRAWLDERGIQYHGRSGVELLREQCRAAK